MAVGKPGCFSPFSSLGGNDLPKLDWAQIPTLCLCSFVAVPLIQGLLEIQVCVSVKEVSTHAESARSDGAKPSEILG